MQCFSLLSSVACQRAADNPCTTSCEGSVRTLPAGIGEDRFEACLYGCAKKRGLPANSTSLINIRRLCRYKEFSFRVNVSTIPLLSSI
ncbi:MAG: hypothetical protein NTX06_00545, partial [Proteobacteria bacterium]|nr:hypothetical protein [Pseudomonadota bacterium]